MYSQYYAPLWEKKLLFISRAMSWDKMAKAVMKGIHDQKFHCNFFFPLRTPFLNCINTVPIFPFYGDCKVT